MTVLLQCQGSCFRATAPWTHFRKASCHFEDAASIVLALSQTNNEKMETDNLPQKVAVMGEI